MSLQLPPERMSFLEQIAVENGREKKKAWYGGCWDVLAWKGQDYVFIEAKRVRKDTMRRAQFQWFEAARKVAVPLTSFVIVEWDTL